jgi:gliding motility-associated-like protein
MTGTGTGAWAADASNPAVVSFVNTASPTTSVSGFTASGAYTLYWSLNGCSDTVLINVTAKPDAGPDQTLCLPGTITTAASAGAGLWTALVSNPATSTIVSPNNPVTTISGFTTGGTYSYVWTVNGCSDTMSVSIIPLSPAGPDQTTCQYTTVTTAAFGNGAWTIITGNPSATTIANAAAGITTISGFNTAGTYGYVWLVNGCSDTMYVTVVAKPDAGADQTICQYSTTAMAATGSGTWTANAGNPALVNFTNASDPLTSVSGFTAAGTYAFYWSLNGCSDTMLIHVTAKPNAGNDQTICQYSTTTMTGTGAGTWTSDAVNPAVVNFVNAASPTTSVSGFSASGIYTFYWSLNGCSDTVLINVTAKPDAGSDQAFCQYSTTVLTATGTGTWTTAVSNPAALTFVDPTSPTTSVSGFTAAGTYTLYWSLNGCSDTMLINVTAKPNAGADQTVCQFSTTTLTGTGTGAWTADAANPAVVNFVNAASPTTSVFGFTSSGTYTFYWSLNGCSDTVLINVTAKPDAGADQTICQYSGTSLSATGAGTWTAEATNPATVNFVNTSDPLSSVSGFSASGIYSLYWSLNGCSDTVLINVTAKPNAGADQTICQYSTTVMAATGSGTWTVDAGNPAVVTLVNTTSPTSSVSGFTVSGTYTLYWTLNGCSDTVLINVTSKPDAGSDQTICQYSNTVLSATGTGTWTAEPTNPAALNFVNTSDPLTSVSGFSAAGSYALYWSLNGCSDTVVITVTPKPNAGSDQTICQYSTTAMSATGSGTWTLDAANPAVISLVSTTDPVTSVSGFTVPGTYTLYWSLNGCSDTVLINVTAKPDAGPDQNVCQFTTINMAAAGAGTWSALSSNPSAATITSPASATSTITALNSVGTYGFIWTVNGCADTMNIVVNTQPTISLRDTAICLNKNATLVPTVVPTGGTYLWSTSETSPTITVSPTLSTGFTVTYTLGICSATAADTVTVDPLPVATVVTIASVCTANNGLAIANPSAGTPGYTYSWSSPGGTGDTLSNLTPGPYQVTVTDINHCTTTASGTVALQNPAIMITELSHHDLRCFNDSSGSIQVSISDTARTSGGYIYLYDWSDNTHNQDLSNVSAGSYTITVTDQYGCLGQASYTITQPAAITGLTSFANPQCHAYSNGSASIGSLSGGSGAYHFAWSTSPVQNTASITGLVAGQYTVSVTDDSLCLVSYSVTLADPLAITFANTIITNPTCAGDSNGTAQVVPQNGIGSYTYSWNIGQNTNPATGLYPGTFSVRVTDANGCSATTSVTLVPLTQLDVTLTKSDVKCYGTNTGMIVASTTGGTAPYRYLWNTQATTATISNLPIGTYSVSATDNNGCTASNSATLTQPTKLTESLSSVRTNCPNTADGVIYDTAQGGTGAVTFTLQDSLGNVLQTGNTTGTFTGLGYGPYIVVATDQNNCPVSETIDVPRAPFNYYTDSVVGTSCYGSQYRDGILHLQGYSIPNGPFLYSVDNSPFQSIPDFFDLSAGPHTVTAQDNYGCDTTFTIIVPEPLPAVLQILPGDSTITAGSTLQLSTEFAPYPSSSITNYAWTPVTGLSCIDCPDPVASPFDNQTTYTLVVTYNKGCTATASIQINANGTPPIFIPNGFTPNGDGVNDEWQVFGTGIKDIKATVYNRWGEKVFESDDQSQGWDGTYRGQAQPPGVYVYLVDVVYLSGEKVTKHGSLTLIR